MGGVVVCAGQAAFTDPVGSTTIRPMASMAVISSNVGTMTRIDMAGVQAITDPVGSASIWRIR
jgi:hypothetical protein